MKFFPVLSIVVYGALLLVTDYGTSASNRVESFKGGIEKALARYDKNNAMDLETTKFTDSLDNPFENKYVEGERMCAGYLRFCGSPQRFCCPGLRCYCKNYGVLDCKCFPPSSGNSGGTVKPKPTRPGLLDIQLG